jgi:hypothetical protein
MFVMLATEIWVLDRVALKLEVEVGWVSWGSWFLWSLCVFRCISVVEGACVRDCRGLGLCKVDIVGWSAGGECVGVRGSLVTGWGRWVGKVKAWEESG